MVTVTSDEDKLILNGELFYSVRTFMRQKKTSAEIIAKIEELSKRGADLNACDKNDNDNTILHIAIQREEKDVIIYLLQKSDYIFSIADKQRALKLVLQKDTIVGKEIAEIISRKETSATSITGSCSSKQETKFQEISSNRKADNKTSYLKYTYEKREGTSGVSGQFYETKLLSLILHRALHDKDIEEFYLATNVKDIGGWDDVCFRYDDVVCFMQCKHTENIDNAKLTVSSIRSNKDKFSLGTYFDSFLKIRQKFSLKTSDPMFKGKFNEINSYFILYTPLKQEFHRKLGGNKQVVSKLHDLICTDGEGSSEIKTNIFQFDFEDCDLDILTKFIKYKDITILAKTFLKCIILNNVTGMMNSELIRRYHPALAQTVINISKETPIYINREQKPPNVLNNNYILIGKFREEFFCSENIYLMKLKDIFYTEIIFTHSPKTADTKEEVKQKIQNIAKHICAKTIAELIGSPLNFDDKKNQLFLDIKKLPKNMFQQNEIEEITRGLQNIHITKAMIRDAVYLMGKKKLQALTFQLPNTFGNTDLNANKKRRLDFLAVKFQELIECSAEKNKNEDTKIVNISNDDDSDCIGGAVGNLLEFDKQSELFTFNTKDELPENAKYVRKKLQELIGKDLSAYKFNVFMDGFPRISFDVFENDRNIAREFLSKLWFYTKQAKEELVEIIIKDEISRHYNSDMQTNQFLFHVHSDAIFLQFHDKVQKWWKSPTDTMYLTKDTTFYKDAKQDIVDRPLLTVLTLMFMRHIKALNIEFNMSTVEDLGLCEFSTNNKYQGLNIASDAVILSAAKLMQYDKHQKHCSFINLDYIHILPQNDYEIMIEELKLLKDATVVIVSEAPIKERLQDTLLNILKAFTKSHMTIENYIIIITCEILQINFPNYDFITLKDENVNFINLSSQSQTYVLNTYEVVFQGQKVKLKMIIDDSSKYCINAKLLSSLLKNENIEIGYDIFNHNYNKIKNHFISPNLERNGQGCVINTLHDVDDMTVLILSKPGIDKTVLLTHLSLETKKIDPKLWIVKVDMPLHSNDLEKLKNNCIEQNMSFLAKVAIKNSDELEKVTFIKINKEAVSINSEDIENVSFELQIFINFYNKGNIMFLFDGFDEIYPRYTNEALALFTALRQANKRIWITSDCRSIRNLTEIFGPPYELEPLRHTKKTGLLDRFWAINVKLEKLSYEQYNNVKIYLDYVLNFFNLKYVIEDVSDRHKVAFISGAFHILYLMLLDYFKDEGQSLSWIYIREKIKKEWNIHSYTAIDCWLQNVKENESLQFTGIPFIKYVAENYFTLKISDQFDIHLNSNTILDRTNSYMNILSLYKLLLILNIKKVCDTTSIHVIEADLSGSCNVFFNNHKKFLLYAIYKKNDVSKILSLSEINEIEKTINMIESGKMKADLFNTVIDTYPRDHFIFAQYFFLETLSDLLPHIKNGNFNDVKLESFWDLFVNVILAIGPPTLRNAFKYRLKYNPDAPGITSSDSNRIVFDLIFKKTSDHDDALTFAINEGLIIIINFLVNNIRKNISEDSADLILMIIQKSVSIFEELDLTWLLLNEFLIGNIENLDGKTIVDFLKLFQVGHDITDKIKDFIVESVEIIIKKVVELSRHNKNVIKLVEEMQHQLPHLIREIFKMIDIS